MCIAHNRDTCYLQLSLYSNFVNLLTNDDELSEAADSPDYLQKVIHSWEHYYWIIHYISKWNSDPFKPAGQGDQHNKKQKIQNLFMNNERNGTPFVW